MITDTFDKTSPAILTPKHLGTSAMSIPDKVFSVFDSRLTKRIISEFNPKKVTKLYAGHSVPFYEITYKDSKIGFFQSEIGGPASVALLETLYASGCEKILYLGTCGSLDNRMHKGSLVVPTKAYRDEGTSYHYMEPSSYVDIPTSRRLSDILTDLNIPYVSTGTWTTDAIFRETKNLIEKRKQEGYTVVEMECASITACSQFRGKESYHLLFTADCLDGKYDTGLLTGNIDDTIDWLLQVGMDSLLEV